MIRFGLWIWAALLISSLAIIGSRLSDGLPLEADLLRLLPQQDETAEWVTNARVSLEGDVVDRALILVSHKQKSSAAKAALTLQTTLIENGIFQESTKLTDVNRPSEAALFFPYRMGLLSRQDLEFLEERGAKGIAQSAKAMVFAPLGFANAALLQNDPYLLLPRFLAENAQSAPDRDVETGLPFWEQEGAFHFILNHRLIDSPFSPGFQTRFEATVALQSEQLMAQFGDLNIRKTGAIVYASHATSSAKWEISRIGGLSVFAILILVLMVFRGLQPILFSLLAMFCAVTFGLAVNLMIFETIHLMSLVFGASLLGISVDYAMHYCCARFSADSTTPALRVNSVFNGLTFGLISSVLGFACFAFTPFPGLQQIAVFSAAGLMMAYLTVVFVFPKLDRGESTAFPPIADKLMYWISTRIIPRQIKHIILIVVLTGATIIGFGYHRIDADDSIRRLQNLPENLRTEENEIRTIVKSYNEAQFFLIRGQDEETVLQLEEALRRDLDFLVDAGGLEGYFALSNLVPSRQRQEKARRAVRDQLLGDRLQQLLAEIGQDGSASYVDYSKDYLTLDQLRAHSGFEWVERFGPRQDRDQAVHAVALKGVNDLVGLRYLGQINPNVQFIDPATEISQTLAKYSQRAVLLLVAAIVLIAGFLSLRYGIRKGLIVIAAPVVAVVLTPFVLALFGSIFTLFNALGLILVLVLGLDYALFCVESTQENLRVSLLANALSAASTILAFGLLIFSQQYAVHAFGATILVGIFLAFCLAPMSRILQGTRA